MNIPRLAAAALTAVLVFAAGASAQTTLSGAVAADPLTAAQIGAIDTIAATVIERRATPSVAIGIAKNGRLVFAKGYGYRNLDDKVPADAETMYGIGSNTKQFTAASILMLRDQGKLDIDAPLARYLPGIPHGNEVLIRNLLTHTGGYAEYTELDDIDRLGARPATNAEIVEAVAARPLGFKPGTKWQYSNTAYVMLAMVVEKLSGMSYEDFLRSRIFEPLGMTRTHFEDQQMVETDRATGYTRFAMGEQEHEQHLDYTWFSGAGAIESTVGDLEKWNNAIDRGTLLTPGSRDLMHATMKLADGTDTHYGFGLFMRTLPDGKHVVLHGGDTTGFGSQDARFVEDGLDLIVLTNQEPAAYNAIMNAVYRVLVTPAEPAPESAAGPRRRRARAAGGTDRDPVLQTRAGRVRAALARRRRRGYDRFGPAAPLGARDAAAARKASRVTRPGALRSAHLPAAQRRPACPHLDLSVPVANPEAHAGLLVQRRRRRLDRRRRRVRPESARPRPAPGAEVIAPAAFVTAAADGS